MKDFVFQRISSKIKTHSTEEHFFANPMIYNRLTPRIYEDHLQHDNKRANYSAKKGAKYLSRQGSKEGLRGAQEGCPPPVAVMDMHVKPLIRHWCAPARTVPIEAVVTKKRRRGCGETGALMRSWWKQGAVKPFWKTLCYPASPLPGSLPRGDGVRTKACAHLFGAASCIIAKSGNNPNIHQQVSKCGTCHKTERCSETHRRINHSFVSLEHVRLMKEASYKRPRFMWLCLCEFIQGQRGGGQLPARAEGVAVTWGAVARVLR